MPKILLMDGPAIAYRSHFALAKSGLMTLQGQSTAATYGYTTAVLRLLRQENPEYAVVAFDTEKPTYRHELFEEYKADRPAMPEELAGQLDWIRKITRGLGVHILAIDGYEADDVIGTLAAQACEAGIQVVIATGDKDMLQLLAEGTKVIMLSGWGRDTKVMDEKSVVAKYGITPELLPDYFALMGDAIDNVPGVPGVGPKTASLLVKRYGKLESIYENLDKLPSKRIRMILSQNRDVAFSSRELVTVHREVPLPLGLLELRRGDLQKSVLQEIFRQLGFRTLARQVISEGERPSVKPRIWHEPGSGQPGSIACRGVVGMEVNLDGDRASISDILGVALCCGEQGHYYFPLKHREPGNISASGFKDAAGQLLEDQKVSKVVHDAKRVLVAMKRLGIGVKGISFDGQLAAYVLNPGRGGMEVDDLGADYLGEFHPGSKARSRAPLLTLKQASEHCCARAGTLLRLAQVMGQELRAKELWRLYVEVELPLAWILADMELRGVKIDRTHLEALSAELDKRLAMTEKEAYLLAGKRFNLNSPREISRILFEEMGLRPLKKTKTGYSTDNSVLTELGSEHELPRKILDYRQLAKLKSTHVDQLLRFADPATDRIHASFHQSVTATGRLSSSDPNLQNVPIRGELGGEIRKGFIPSEPDWVLLSADYSQIELRVVAHLSGDENLRQAFHRGEDIHARTAAFIFKVDPSQVSYSMRSIAKAVNFGIIYGMGAQSLAKTTGLTVEEASGFLERHRQTYPGLYSYLDESLNRARETGYVETILGRRRYLPNLTSTEPASRSAAERMAVNTPVQGSAADIIKVAMLGIYRQIQSRGLRGGIVIQVHDEILVDCPDSEKDAFERLLGQHMRGAYDLAVPLQVEVRSGKNWFQAH